MYAILLSVPINRLPPELEAMLQILFFGIVISYLWMRGSHNNLTVVLAAVLPVVIAINLGYLASTNDSINSMKALTVPMGTLLFAWCRLLLLPIGGIPTRIITTLGYLSLVVIALTRFT